MGSCRAWTTPQNLSYVETKGQLFVFPYQSVLGYDPPTMRWGTSFWHLCLGWLLPEENYARRKKQLWALLFQDSFLSRVNFWLHWPWNEACPCYKLEATYFLKSQIQSWVSPVTFFFSYLISQMTCLFPTKFPITSLSQNSSFIIWSRILFSSPASSSFWGVSKSRIYQMPCLL